MAMRFIAVFMSVFMSVLMSGGVARGEGEEDVTFTLTNTSAQAVTAVLAAVPGEGEVDLLNGMLEPDSSVDVMKPAGEGTCVRNLRIVFADQTERHRLDVDLCNIDGFLID